MNAKDTVRYVVGLLASEDYDSLGRLSDGTLTADELRLAISRYGGVVLAEPFDLGEFEALDSGSGWWTDVDLYTVEEGRSDLTLSLTLLDASGAHYGVQIEDLRTL